MKPPCYISSFTLGNPLHLKCSWKLFYIFIQLQYHFKYGIFTFFKNVDGPIVRNCPLLPYRQHLYLIKHTSMRQK
jgi:hypothetical protein